LIYFELFTDIANLRSCIGKEVVYRCDQFTEYKGVLTTCRYELNDKFGFFCLRIGIKGEKRVKVYEQIVVYEKYEIFVCISPNDIKKIICSDSVCSRDVLGVLFR
jgi:hypothetical protein